MSKYLTFNDYYNEENNRNSFNYMTLKAYNSMRAYYVKKFYTLEEFKSEVVIFLYKHWGYYVDKFNNHVNTFIHGAIYRTISRIYERMNAEKRQANYYNSHNSLDNEEENYLDDLKYNDEYSIYSNELLNKIIENIPKQINKKIAILYLKGMTQSEIVQATGLSQRQVCYFVDKKLKPLAIKIYNEVE